MATGEGERHGAPGKEHLAMNTPPIVSAQEWEGCAAAASGEGEGLHPLA